MFVVVIVLGVMCVQVEDLCPNKRRDVSSVLTFKSLAGEQVLCCFG